MAIGPAALVCFQAGVNNTGARLVCPGFDEGRLWASSYPAGWNLSADFFFFFLHQRPKAFLEVCSKKTKAVVQKFPYCILMARCFLNYSVSKCFPWTAA